MLHFILVYKFKCNICNNILYGKTKGHFKVKACYHLAITTLTGKKVKISNKSAVFDHIFHTGHNASFDEFETLIKESDNFDSSSENHFWHYVLIHIGTDMSG